MMNYYFNENAFLQNDSPHELAEQLKEFKALYDAAEQNQGILNIKDTFRYESLRGIPRLEDSRKYAVPFLLFQKCRMIPMENCEKFAVEKIVPEINSETVRELICVCNRDQEERMVSLSTDYEAVADVYHLEGAALNQVINIRSALGIADYSLHNPYPSNINMVFRRVEDKFPSIVFLKEAYKTAGKRESAYRKIGYDRILVLFKIMNEILLPFYRKEAQGQSEADVFSHIHDAYGIDISTESQKTMDLYGKQRAVQIDGITYAMKNHIKFKKDACRIYFMYIESKDKIYIGHSGKHLDTVGG